jgi:hypothetical protein
MTDTSIPYFEQRVPDIMTLCSWDECPCSQMGDMIPRGGGYLYITQRVVDFRKDCLSWEEFEAKLVVYSDYWKKSCGVDSINFAIYVPTLVCEKGIDLLDIDKAIAREDAIRWWQTGKVPLRVSPKKTSSN